MEGAAQLKTFGSAIMSEHKIISFIKSGIRIAGCLFGMLFFWGNFFPMHAFAFFLLAEVLGVIEEFFEVTPSPMIPEYTDWSGTPFKSPDFLQRLDSETWRNGPDGASFGVSFGPKE